MSNMREIIVDNFAGGGGASTGIAMAIGRSVDIAINHDPVALAMHMVNHPDTEHYCENVWDVDPRQAAKGRPVALVWLSPDCKHFSKAKGGKPVEKHIRGLAWVAVRWAATVRPRVIILENVEEFKTWGPLLKNGKPDPKQKGRTFQAFINALKRQGYQVDYRELRACDYGAPTIRKRLFLIARCDGRPIMWPKPTHGDPESPEVKSGKLKPWRTAAEIIDWSLPCQSIFERKRPLAENTMRRIARGIQRFVLENPKPFIVQVNYSGNSHHYCRPVEIPLSTITAKNGFGIVSPVIGRQFGRSVGHSMYEPLGTVTVKDKNQLVVAFLAKHYGGNYTGPGSSINRPIPTVTVKDHNALVTSHLIKLRGTCQHGQMVTEPMSTITAGGLHVGEVRTLLIKHFEREEQDGCHNSRHVHDRTRDSENQTERRDMEARDQNKLRENYSDRAEESRMPAKERISGNQGLRERKSVSSPCASRDMDSFTRGNTKGDGHQPQRREQAEQFSREPGVDDSKRKPSTRFSDGAKDVSRNYIDHHSGCKATSETGNVILKNCESAEDISNNSIQSRANEVKSFITKYYGTNIGQACDELLQTITTKHRFGLVTIHGQDYQIVDIGMRMLEPHELFAAQGFPANYIIDRDNEGNRFSKATQVALCGNAVPPVFAESLVRANLPELCINTAEIDQIV